MLQGALRQLKGERLQLKAVGHQVQVLGVFPNISAQAEGNPFDESPYRRQENPLGRLSPEQS